MVVQQEDKKFELYVRYAECKHNIEFFRYMENGETPFHCPGCRKESRSLIFNTFGVSFLEYVQHNQSLI